MKQLRSRIWRGPCAAAILGLATIGLFPLVAVAAPAPAYYVATNGDDANPGTADRPFQTLERAREEIRRTKNSGALPAGGLSVVVRGGTYCLQTNFVLGPGESGTASAPVTWTAAANEIVRLSGGILLPADAFQTVTNEKILTRLEASARPHVVQADLRARGVVLRGRYPDVFRGAPVVPELFFNDQRQTVARWPNDGWATIAGKLERGTMNPASNPLPVPPPVFEYGGDRPARWDVAAGVWLLGYWCYDWYEETIRVESVDTNRHEIVLAKAPHYGIRQGNPLPRRYRAVNLLEELDQPGEYYLDPAAGQLYFWPPSDPAGARITLSLLAAPLLELKNASNVVARGLIIEAGLGDGIDISGGRSNRIDACEIRNLRQTGIRVSGGTGHRITDCNVHDTGAGGVVLEGGNRRTLTPAGHEAVNNRIWRFARHQLTYAGGIVLAGVGNRAAHNEIYDAPHMAVGISGNDHVFEFNYVHDVCTASDDAGALYKGRNPSCRGNLIRYNFWRDIGNPSGSGTTAVYFDDGDGGDTVCGNIFLRCGYPGKGNFGAVFSHGGHGLLAENNIFIDCRRALGSTPWNDQHWHEELSGRDWQNKLLREVDITRPPYTTHYPELAGFMDGPPAATRLNRAKNNVLVRCALPNSGNWTNAPAEVWSTDRDPGFVDFAARNLELRPDGELFKHLPAFQSIPFEKIGLQAGAP